MEHDQGKSITTSVPSFAIRFHTEDEELEEIYPSMQDTDEEPDKPATEDEILSTPLKAASATASTIHSRDPSPMKEYLKGFGKRSTSVDAGMIKAGTVAGSSTDTWRIFHELKGKFTKTVEEKFSEIKSDRKSGSSVLRKGRLVAGGGSSSKDDSSMNSDSEDVSESSKKNEEIHSESKSQDSPAKKPAADVDVEDVGKAGVRKRKLETATGGALQGIEEYEVESGVEAREDEGMEEWEKGIPTTDYRGTMPFSVSELPERTRHRKTLAQKLWRWRKAFLFALVVLLYIVIPIPPYVLGFCSGIMLTVAAYAAHRHLSFLFSKPNTVHSRRESAEVITEKPVVKVHAAKEYHQLLRYEGWMNEYPAVYDPETYKVSQTQSVYARLEGSTLKIYHTKQRIPKRAMWNEHEHKMKFYHQRIYNIAYSELKLLPTGLARNKLWSKKYPICIVLKKHDDVKSMRIDTDDDDDYLSLDRSPSASDISSIGRQPSTEQEDQEFLEAEEDSFCHVELDIYCLYLFSRTDREKEIWYRKFAMAIRESRNHADEEDLDQLKTHLEHHTTQIDQQPQLEQHKAIFNHHKTQVELPRTIADNSLSTWDAEGPSAEPEPTAVQEDDILSLPVNDFMTLPHFEHSDYEYLRFMAKTQQSTPPPSKRQDRVDGEIEKEVQKPISPAVMWVNALVGRVVFDIMNNPSWHEKIKHRLQRKLSSIKLPYFIEELSLTEMDLGHSMPIIHETSRPILDERGVWVDLEITYDGSICCTLETKLNLMKIKNAGQEAAQQEEGPTKKPHIYDSELDDSAESSEEDEDDKSSSAEEHHSHAGTKVIRLVNRIAASKYFQQATEYKYIKNVMEQVSNTKLILSVTVNGLVGTLVVNIPPPPSDRLWYGFRNIPQIWLQARPKFGERQLSVSHVTSWIEKKLFQEFQKKFVLPNMDDLVIPPMSAALPE